ncbi:MAG: sulfurtransferase TusA family protein [Bacteroidales bacterium]|nr:sulfurtransferase TusA family protein [Bacteroidales bacterium]
MEITETLDCKGLSCPMPMMKLSKAMKKLKSGDILEMLGTDPGTKADLPAWCEKTGNELLEQEEIEGGVTRMVIKKK